MLQSAVVSRQFESPSGSIFVKVQIACGSFVVTVASLVLVGWLFGLEQLKRIVPGFVAMNPVTALCLLLAAIALLATKKILICRIAAAIIIAIAAAKLLDIISSIPLAVDQVFFSASLIDPTGAPNRMAPNTALALLLLGSSLLCSFGRYRVAPLLSQALAASVVAIAMFALIGYLLGIAHLYGVERFIPMALHTAVCLIVLAVGVFTRHPGTGLMEVIRDRGPAGTLARTTLPLAVFVPVLVGFVRVLGQRAGLYGTETGVALQVIANVIVTFALLLGIILALHRSDRLRRRREAAVASSEKQFRLAEQVAHVGHWRMALPSKQVEWSDEIYRIAGLDPALGKPSADEILKLYHPDDRAKARAAVIRALKTGKGWDFTVRLVRPNGEIRWVKSHSVTERGTDEEVCAVFGVFADVTELETARHAAVEATSAKSTFLANMSHEIRTPLNSIIGFTDLLLEDSEFHPKHRRQLELIQNSGGALLTVVNDILDLSKLEAGKVELNCQPFSFEMFVDNTVSIVVRLAEAKGLEMRVHLDPQLSAYYLGDEDRLRQVLLNLINNAVKFTAQGSVIVAATLVSRAEDVDRVRVEIRDTGSGISPEKQSRLFQQFTQADSSVSREHGGTGLGLAISKNLIEIMDGEIGLTSVEGSGSTFWFELDLPVSDKPVHAILPASADGDDRTADILLAEDLPINQELACAILTRAGHRVDVASNGVEAVRMVQQKRYDLVLMDIQMPKMDGITATQEIRSLAGAESDIPILALTANVLPEQIMEFKRIGMNGSVAKPIKQAQLHSEIQRVLAGTEVSEAADADNLPAGADVFDEEVYSKIARLLPTVRMQSHMTAFELQLRSVFHESDPQNLKASAHKLVSQAGMLGFMQLSEACRGLEEACSEGQMPSPALRSAQTAADAALPVVESLIRNLRLNST